MQLHDLLAGLSGSEGAGSPELRGDPGVDVGSVVHDSREVRPGALFCCIRGENADGHRYAADAVAAGAVALLVEEWLPIAVPQARVRSVRHVLGPMAARFFGSPVAGHARARRHGHQRQDHHHVPARVDRGRGGRPSGRDRDGRGARRGA